MCNRMNGMNRAGHIGAALLMLLGMAALAGCATSLQDVEVTPENQAELWEQLRKSNELTLEENELLDAYLARQDLEEGVKLPSGLSVREMIAQQKGFEQGTGTPEDESAPEEKAAPEEQRASNEPSTSNPPQRDSGSSSSPPARSDSPRSSEPAKTEEPPEPPPPTTASLPAGTAVKVRLEEALSTKTDQAGETFEASLDKDLIVDGHLLAPEGSRVIGKITNAKRSGKVKGRAEMSIRLDAIVADGKRYDFRSNTLAFQAEGSKKGDAKKIGIGAGVGAVIGAIAGGGKGAAIGTAIGAGAGTGAVLMTRGDEVEFGVEQLFEFKTDKAVEMDIIRQ